MSKRPSLLDMSRKKPAAVLDDNAASGAGLKEGSTTNDKGDGRKGVLVRLSPESWHLLGVLAGELTLSTGERHTKQSLLVEGLNDLLKRHGKPPIA